MAIHSVSLPRISYHQPIQKRNTPVLSHPIHLPQQEVNASFSTLALNSLKPLSILRFSGLNGFTYRPEDNIVFSLKKRAESHPDGVALTTAKNFAVDENGEVLTNKSLYEGALKVAKVLKEKYNIQPGDRVATIETNTEEFFKTFFATLALGATLVPINILPLADKLGAKEKLAHMLKLSNAKALFIGKIIHNSPEFKDLKELKRLEPLLKPGKRFVLKKLLPLASKTTEIIPGRSEKVRKFREKLDTLNLMLNSLPAGLRIITPIDTRNFSVMKDSQMLLEKDMVLTPKGEQEAIMLYTSGTTSMPKAVPITHGALVHNILSLTNYAQEITANDKQILILPMFHIFGLSTFMACLAKGAQSILIPSPTEGARNPAKLLDTIQQEGVTILPAIPKILERLVKQEGAREKLKSVKIMLSGGEKLAKSLYDNLKTLTPNSTVWEGYGMTESGIITLNREGSYGNVGKPISPHIQLELRGQNGQGVGEIWTHTPSRGEPYLGLSPEEASDIFKPEGWLHTGDLGMFDDSGNLKIVGRSKEIIKRAGEILSPEDFDTRMSQVLNSKLKDSITFSYTPPGTEGEKVMTIALLNPATQSETENTLKEILQTAVQSGTMAGRYVPDYILPLTKTEFPTGFISALGKKQYKACREYLNKLAKEETLVFTKQGVQINTPEKL